MSLLRRRPVCVCAAKHYYSTNYAVSAGNTANVTLSKQPKNMAQLGLRTLYRVRMMTDIGDCELLVAV